MLLIRQEYLFFVDVLLFGGYVLCFLGIFVDRNLREDLVPFFFYFLFFSEIISSWIKKRM